MKKTILLSLCAMLTFSVSNAQNTQKERTVKPKISVNPVEVNTKQADIGTAFFRDKFIMTSSRKTGSLVAGKDKSTNEPYTRLYCTDIDQHGNLHAPMFFSHNLKSDGNQGSVTFSPDEKRIYHTKSSKNNSKSYQLYKSDYDTICRCNLVTEDPVAFNSSEYSIENPIITADGKKMYFSSNMLGGYGGYDLYVAEINENGMPVNPTNLGDIINTSGDEVYPYITRNKNEIYFSSDGHEGFGGLDVFVSKIKKNGFSKPENMGKPLNSAQDEIAFLLATKNKGYLSSNRPNPNGGSYDIYSVDIENLNLKLNGTVFETESKVALPNTRITLLDDEGTEVASKTVTENGAFSFEVNPQENYTLIATKEGYSKFETPIITSSNGNSKFDVAMSQESAKIIEANHVKYVAFEKIYFDFNKSTIKEESKLSLNKLVKILNEDKAINININAHTDNKGPDAYNLTLSEKRAQSTKQYLIEQGINAKRLKAKGFGESQSLSNCKANCTTEQLEMDRRVDFIIQN